MFSEERVKTGSTVLSESHFARLAGCKVGFIGNHTSRLNSGSSTVAELIKSQVCTVVRLFAPEHGAHGAYDDMVDDETDTVTGIKVYSLYGKNRKPTPAMLAGLDCILFELQDVGARFYTYSATLLLAIDAAHEAGIKVFVLDRPNPIGGMLYDGPYPDEGVVSFVAPYRVPIQFGLTLGELASLYAAETNKTDTVEIIKLDGWDRSFYFEDTGLDWISPSPAMRSVDTAIVYPGVCLIEQTNVSVGRGTRTPFEVAGAPFIVGPRLADTLSAQNYPGVSVTPTSFVPTASKYEGEKCGGIRLAVTDRRIFRPVRFGVLLAATLWKLYKDDFDLDGMQNILASGNSLTMLKVGATSDEIATTWSRSLTDWTTRRQYSLLY